MHQKQPPPTTSESSLAGAAEETAAVMVRSKADRRDATRDFIGDRCQRFRQTSRCQNAAGLRGTTPENRVSMIRVRKRASGRFLPRHQRRINPGDPRKPRRAAAAARYPLGDEKPCRHLSRNPCDVAEGAPLGSSETPSTNPPHSFRIVLGELSSVLVLRRPCDGGSLGEAGAHAPPSAALTFPAAARAPSRPSAAADQTS